MTLCKGTVASILHSGVTFAAMLGCLFALTQCKGEFTGPYPCEPGYDSCINPEKNQCETDILNDAAHCGTCNTQCGIGDTCVNGERSGKAVVTLAHLSDSDASQTPLAAVAGSNVFWSVNGANSIYRVPNNGGTVNTIAQNVQSCGSAVGFAVDAQSVYYWSNNASVPCPNGSGGTCNASGVVRTTADTSQTTSLIWTPPSQSNGQCPFAFAVANSSVYWLSNQNGGGMDFYSALLSGTSTRTDPIATMDKANWNGGFWVDDQRAAFVASNDSPSMLYQVSLSNGKQTTVSTTLGNQNFGANVFAADKDYAYVASGGCNCNNDSKVDTLPSGRIARFAWDGSSSLLLAEFSGAIASMAVDGTSVYWATDTTVWKVPKAGGSAVRIAGNLANGGTPYLCSNGCGTQMPSNVAIAVDGTSVYIVDTSSRAKVVLKVSK
jgi:hypothetical protein